MNTPQEILGVLKGNGHRHTVARTALIEILAADHQPLAVADLLSALAKRGLRLNKTTLYRELAFLQEQGIVTDIRLGERQVRYELVDADHHHHLVCTSCDTVEDVNMADDLKEQERRIERATKFKIQRHALEFFGLCQACQTAS